MSPERGGREMSFEQNEERGRKTTQGRTKWMRIEDTDLRLKTTRETPNLNRWSNNPARCAAAVLCSECALG